MRKIPTRRQRCGGEGCGALLLALAIAAVAGSGLAIRHGPYWLDYVVHQHAPGVVIHHTATGATANGQRVNAELVDRAHEQRGWGLPNAHKTYHIGYHYLVLPDGTVEAGRPEWMPGAHCWGHNHYLGVCLVGNFSSRANPAGTQRPAQPTVAQLRALDALLGELMDRHGFGPGDIHAHSDFGATECPGDRCPIDEVRRKLEGAAK